MSHSPPRLTLSWPADHTGWRLQAQTNNPTTGLGTNWFDVPGSAMIIPAYILTVGAGVLMVSSIGYYSFKDLKLQGRVPFAVLLLVPLLIMVIFLSPQNVLFLGFLLYAVTGLALALWRLYKRRGRKPA